MTPPDHHGAAVELRSMSGVHPVLGQHMQSQMCSSGNPGFRETEGLMREATAGSRLSKIPPCSALTGMSCPLSAASGDGQPQEQGWPLAAARGLGRKGSKFKYVTCL